MDSFCAQKAIIGLEITAVRSLAFAQTRFLIRSGNPSSLCLHSRLTLYDLDKVPAPDGDTLCPLPFPGLFAPAKGDLGMLSRFRPSNTSKWVWSEVAI
ncbi:MAG: hypothetical protein ACLQBD_18035 [Syntrophobacteraceae bacterium]